MQAHYGDDVAAAAQVTKQYHSLTHCERRSLDASGGSFWRVDLADARGVQTHTGYTSSKGNDPKAEPDLARRCELLRQASEIIAEGTKRSWKPLTIHQLREQPHDHASSVTTVSGISSLPRISLVPPLFELSALQNLASQPLQQPHPQLVTGRDALSSNEPGTPSHATGTFQRFSFHLTSTHVCDKGGLRPYHNLHQLAGFEVPTALSGAPQGSTVTRSSKALQRTHSGLVRLWSSSLKDARGAGAEEACAPHGRRHGAAAVTPAGAPEGAAASDNSIPAVLSTRGGSFLRAWKSLVSVNAVNRGLAADANGTSNEDEAMGDWAVGEYLARGSSNAPRPQPAASFTRASTGECSLGSTAMGVASVAAHSGLFLGGSGGGDGIPHRSGGSCAARFMAHYPQEGSAQLDAPAGAASVWHHVNGMRLDRFRPFSNLCSVPARSFHLATAYIFMACVSTFAPSVLLEVAKSDLELPQAAVGGAAIAALVLPALAHFPMSTFWLRRVGPRYSQVLLLLLTTPALVCMPLVRTASGFILVRLISGTSLLAFTCSQFWLGVTMRPSELPSAVAYNTAWGSAGAGAALLLLPLLATWLQRWLTSPNAWRSTFYVPATAQVLLAFATLLFGQDTREGDFLDRRKLSLNGIMYAKGPGESAGYAPCEQAPFEHASKPVGVASAERRNGSNGASSGPRRMVGQLASGAALADMELQRSPPGKGLQLSNQGQLRPHSQPQWQPRRESGIQISAGGATAASPDDGEVDSPLARSPSRAAQRSSTDSPVSTELGKQACVHRPGPRSQRRRGGSAPQLPSSSPLENPPPKLPPSAPAIGMLSSELPTSPPRPPQPGPSVSRVASKKDSLSPVPHTSHIRRYQYYHHLTHNDHLTNVCRDTAPQKVVLDELPNRRTIKSSICAAVDATSRDVATSSTATPAIATAAVAWQGIPAAGSAKTASASSTSAELPPHPCLYPSVHPKCPSPHSHTASHGPRRVLELATLREADADTAEDKGVEVEEDGAAQRPVGQASQIGSSTSSLLGSVRKGDGSSQQGQQPCHLLRAPALRERVAPTEEIPRTSGALYVQPERAFSPLYMYITSLRDPYLRILAVTYGCGDWQQ
ncbi:hypothetical protein Vafri_3195 [Volvox africanus]|uniref:Major facilitator superfamily (MFS) profile domain-containing protein n=1 Tax=Volvox africanus TaxID=51714 RepID=A0A8J4EW36_9CHLO|nr:hypothetical protein Vafri_3195 [Volvox africanus]